MTTTTDLTREVETPYGVFKIGPWKALDGEGIRFYAHTEDRKFTVNGVQYEGQLFIDRHRWDGSFFVDAKHCERWSNRKWVAMTESACGKLSDALLPTIAALAADDMYIRAAKVRAIKQKVALSLARVNEGIGEVNGLIAELRGLGEIIPNLLARVENPCPLYAGEED
jgi:hypothetical protein